MFYILKKQTLAVRMEWVNTVKIAETEDRSSVGRTFICTISDSGYGTEYRLL